MTNLNSSDDEFSFDPYQVLSDHSVAINTLVASNNLMHKHIQDLTKQQLQLSELFMRSLHRIDVLERQLEIK